jgi:autonomous glycyl radical cofactor GrcA
LEVRVEVSENVCFDEIKYQELFRERVRTTLAHRLGLHVDVKLLERKSLEDELKKSGKVVDLRLI